MLSPTYSDLFLVFVRPFKTEDKVMRLLNARRPSWLGHAMEPVLNNGLRALTIRRAEAACNSMSHRAQSIFGNPGVWSQCARPAVHQFLEMLPRYLASSPMKQTAKHLVFSARSALQSNILAGTAVARLSILTPNAPMSGAEVRSTKASAPLAG